MKKVVISIGTLVFLLAGVAALAYIFGKSKKNKDEDEELFI